VLPQQIGRKNFFVLLSICTRYLLFSRENSRKENYFTEVTSLKKYIPYYIVSLYTGSKFSAKSHERCDILTRYIDEVYQLGSGFRRAKMTHKNSEEISCSDILF
jgi:hypothetical protein